MNYITEINSFYDWLETNSVSDSGIVLWHALMHISNKAGWIPEFAVAISTLEAKTGLKKGAIIRARQKLEQSGRIKFKSRAGQQSAVYKIIPFAFQNRTQSETQTGHKVKHKPDANRTQSGTINKLNKTKLNETLIYPYQDIVELWNSTCTNLPKVNNITQARKNKIKKRIDELGTGYWEKIKDAFLKARDSDFMRGKNKTGWRATFDWVFENEQNINKILEGNYDNRTGNTANSGTRYSSEADKRRTELNHLEELCEAVLQCDIP